MIDATYDRNGNICIVDFQRKTLVILDPDGESTMSLQRSVTDATEVQKPIKHVRTHGGTK
jgi:hypothetical protein